jgi:hypothetical protein
VQVEVVEADDDQLVRVTSPAGTVTFRTAAYPHVRSDGCGYYTGWAWQADTTTAAAAPLEREDRWRALVDWPVM